MSFIPYGKQEISQQDIDSVVEVLTSDYLTQGPKVPAFENEISNYTGSKYAVAVNSATSALHIACLSLGLGKGDWLWTTPISFVASSNCGLYCGAQVDFVDIDPETYNLCPKALEIKLKQAEQQNRLPKVLVAVHLCGQSCDMRAIKGLADQFNIHVIEDASHAVGGKYLDQAIGGNHFADITIFSFHPVKIITTAEGGVATTNSKALADRLNLFRSHGVTRDSELLEHTPDGPWYYEQLELGYNYRMTDLQAALGISQMQRLDDFVSKRHELAQRYDLELAGLPILLPQQNEDTYSGLHLYVIRLNLDLIKLSRRQVFDQLKEAGVGVNVHYIPIHTQPYYQRMGFSKGDFPHAEQYYAEAISLPMFHLMTETQQGRVIEVLRSILGSS
jgi:UDP-4-amino-4,6-dideoxy-N-acetyl-beta-L-altrosamine transaminase